LFGRYLHYFSSNEKLETHVVDCGEINNCAIKLPNENDKCLCFNNYKKKRVSFVVYVDLECILKKTDSDPRASQHHRVFSLAYYVYCSYDESLCYYRFRRNNYVAWFVEELRNLAYCVKSILSVNVPTETSTSEQWEAFCSVTCVKNRSRRMIHAIIAIWDSSAHSNCNLNYKNSHCISIVFP